MNGKFILKYIDYYIKFYSDFALKYKKIKDFKYVIFIDGEMDGFDRKKYSLIELAAVVYDINGNRIDEFESLFQKEKGYVNDAKFVNHIEESDLLCAPESKFVMNQFLNFLSKYSDSVAIAHNCDFDIMFLIKELSKISHKNIYFKDSIEIFKGAIKTPSYSLDALRCKFGIETDDAHRAKQDCIDLATIFFKVLKKKDIVSFVNKSFTRNLKRSLLEKKYYYLKEKKMNIIFDNLNSISDFSTIHFKYKGKNVYGLLNNYNHNSIELVFKNGKLQKFLIDRIFDFGVD